MPTMLRDHSAVIRYEIEADVRKLVVDLEGWEPSNPNQRVVSDIRPSYVEIGYIVNSHRGYPLFKDGDTIEGLPVYIRGGPDMISVVATGVIIEEGSYVNDFDDWVHGDSWRQDVVVSSNR